MASGGRWHAAVAWPAARRCAHPSPAMGGGGQRGQQRLLGHDSLPSARARDAGSKMRGRWCYTWSSWEQGRSPLSDQQGAASASREREPASEKTERETTGYPRDGRR